MFFSASRVLKFGEHHAGALAEAYGPDGHYLQTPFYTLATPDQKRPMPYVSLPDFEIKDGSMAIAMSSPQPILSRAIPLLTFIQSTVALKLEAKVLAVRPP